MQPPLQVIFNDVVEIRMGSPFNTCNIKLVGDIDLSLPRYSWQDKFAWSKDYKFLILICWANDSFGPAFKIIAINTSTKEILESTSIKGAIISLSVKKETVFYRKFFYDTSLKESNESFEFFKLHDAK